MVFPIWSGDFSVKDRERPGRPVVIESDRILALVDANPHLSLRQVADALGISFKAVHKHLTARDYVNRASVWVPHDRTERQRLQRIEACDQLLRKNENNPFLAFRKRDCIPQRSCCAYGGIVAESFTMSCCRPTRRSQRRSIASNSIDGRQVLPKSVRLCSTEGEWCSITITLFDKF